MKKISFLCALVLLFATYGLSAKAEGQPAAEEYYAPVLAQYEAVFTGDEEALTAHEAAEGAYHYALYMEADPKSVIGYTYIDLNRDAVPELLIGTVGETDDSENMIFEILTLKDHVPVTLIRGWERFRVRMVYDWKVDKYGYYAEGSSGASNSCWEYALAGDGQDGMDWEKCHTLESNYSEEIHHEYWTLDGNKVSEKNAKALIGQWQKGIFHPELRPFMGR